MGSVLALVTRFPHGTDEETRQWLYHGSAAAGFRLIVAAGMRVRTWLEPWLLKWQSHFRQ